MELDRYAPPGVMPGSTLSADGTRDCNIKHRQTRIGDSKRKSMLDQLGAFYRSGHLTQEEYEARHLRASHAVTVEDMKELLADLPTAAAKQQQEFRRFCRAIAGLTAATVISLLTAVVPIVAVSTAGHGLAHAGPLGMVTAVTTCLLGTIAAIVSAVVLLMRIIAEFSE